MTMTTGLFRIGADAELRHTPDGTAVCNVSLAYKYGKPDQSGNRQTGWINAAIWGERAGNSYMHLTKGKEIHACIFDVHIETYNNAEGVPASKLVGTMAKFEFTSGSPKREDDAAGQQKTATPKKSSKQAKPTRNNDDDDFF